MSPQHANYCVQSTAKRIKKSPRWDDEGVASTVGTIMSLLVFLTFMGMFTNQFLPVWMSDNESNHMAQVIGQFTNLKSSIDLSVSNYANSLVAPSPVFIPVMLSSEGIPVFAGPTAGILSLSPEMINMRPMFNVSYYYFSDLGGVKHYSTLDPSNDGGTGGSLELYCPNRYYVEERIVYENGAIILNQTDGEVVIAGPQFSIKNIGSVTEPSRVIMMTQVSLQGKNMTVGGTGSKGLNADLEFAETTAFENSDPGGTTLYLNITTKHGEAWAAYFERTLNGAANLTSGNGYTITVTKVPAAILANSYYVVEIQIEHVTIFDHTHADVRLTVGELSRGG